MVMKSGGQSMGYNMSWYLEAAHAELEESEKAAAALHLKEQEEMKPPVSITVVGTWAYDDDNAIYYAHKQWDLLVKDRGEKYKYIIDSYDITATPMATYTCTIHGHRIESINPNDGAHILT